MQQINSPLILPIPNLPNDKIGASIYKLGQLSKILNETTKRDIALDYTHTKFQSAAFSVGLHILIKHLRKNGKTVKVQNANNNVASYQNATYFPDGLFFGSPDQELLRYYKGTYTPIVVFSSKENKRELAMSAVLEVILKQTNITGKDFINALSYFISELTNNVSDHSGDDFGAIFIQTYPQKKFVDIVIGDNGIGIYRSFELTEKFKPRPYNEHDAVLMAVNGCSTKDLPESRGFGLSTSRRMLIDGLNGVFSLWSGRTVFAHNSDLQRTFELEEGAYFPGCLLMLRLPTEVNLKQDFYSYTE